MHVFIEYTCPTCGILRGGPNAITYGDPYTHTAFFHIVEEEDTHTKYAIIKGLTAKPENPTTTALVRACIKALRKEHLLPLWERYEPDGKIRLIGAPPTIHLKEITMFDVKITLETSQDGAKWSSTVQSYHGMSKEHVQAVEDALAHALLNLKNKKK